MDVDMECAKRAGIGYIHAGWGYGDCESEAAKALKPDDILKLI
jgi:hypothetical protein